jgi:hypothetical protein
MKLTENKIRKIIREEIKNTLNESIATENLESMGYSQREIQSFQATVNRADNNLNSAILELQKAEEKLKVTAEDAVEDMPHDVQEELSKDSSIDVPKSNGNVFYGLVRASRDLGDLKRRLDKISRAIKQISDHV